MKSIPEMTEQRWERHFSRNDIFLDTNRRKTIEIQILVLSN